MAETILNTTGQKAQLPSGLAHLQEILQLGRGKQVAVFLDYDGTLTPITPSPEAAVLSPAMHRTLLKLATKCTVGIISGRDLLDIRRRVNIDAIIYAGSHGFDIGGPGGLRLEQPDGISLLPELDLAHRELSQQLEAIPGVIVERKRFVITVHYRLAADRDLIVVAEAVNHAAAKHPQLRKRPGKKIFELLPAVNWNKGTALLAMLKMLNMNGSGVLPLYLGDDTTDEEAFTELKGKGLGIFVGKEFARSAAAYSLKDCEEVQEFLLELTPFCQI